MKGDRHWRMWSGQDWSTLQGSQDNKFTKGSTLGYQRNWAYTFICLWETVVKERLNNTNGKGYEQEITCLYTHRTHTHKTKLQNKTKIHKI